MISQGEGILICNSYSSRELGFYAQHPHGGSQPSGTPVLGDLILFAALQANNNKKKLINIKLKMQSISRS